jgi:uncharacterized protein YjiS (DUF1127 family)
MNRDGWIGLVGYAIERLLEWSERAQARRMLALAGERAWADLGRSRGTIEDEIAKPCWKP